MTGEAWEPRSLEILGGATGHQFCFLLGSWLLLMPRWSGRGREMTTRTQDIICSFVRSFIRSFIHSFIHAFVHSFIYAFTVTCPQQGLTVGPGRGTQNTHGSVLHRGPGTGGWGSAGKRLPGGRPEAGS